MQPSNIPCNLHNNPLSSNFKIYSFIYKLNSQQEHTPPCLTPLLTLNMKDHFKLKLHTNAETRNKHRNNIPWYTNFIQFKY